MVDRRRARRPYVRARARARIRARAARARISVSPCPDDSRPNEGQVRGGARAAPEPERTPASSLLAPPPTPGTAPKRPPHKRSLELDTILRTPGHGPSSPPKRPHADPLALRASGGWADTTPSKLDAKIVSSPNEWWNQTAFGLRFKERRRAVAATAFVGLFIVILFILLALRRGSRGGGSVDWTRAPPFPPHPTWPPFPAFPSPPPPPAPPPPPSRPVPAIAARRRLSAEPAAAAVPAAPVPAIAAAAAALITAAAAAAAAAAAYVQRVGHLRHDSRDSTGTVSLIPRATRGDKTVTRRTGRSSSARRETASV